MSIINLNLLELYMSVLRILYFFSDNYTIKNYRLMSYKTLHKQAIYMSVLVSLVQERISNKTLKASCNGNPHRLVPLSWRCHHTDPPYITR